MKFYELITSFYYNTPTQIYHTNGFVVHNHQTYKNWLLDWNDVYLISVPHCTLEGPFNIRERRLNHLPLVMPICVSLWIGSAMVQIMACRLFGDYLNSTLRNNIQRISNQDTTLFIHKNAYVNIFCEMAAILSGGWSVSTLRPRRNGQHFADDIYKHIFFNEDVWISIKISLTFVPKGPIYNIYNIPAYMRHSASMS